jgi:HEAT repeat protein
LVELQRDHYQELGIKPSLLLRQMRVEDLRSVTPGLLELLKAPQADVRLQIASLLPRIGPSETKAAIPTLIDLLDESNFNYRLQASQALGKIGPEARAAIPGLVGLLDDGPVSIGASQALSQFGPDAVKPVLDTWYREDTVNRPGVIQALVQLGPLATPAIPKLVEALSKSQYAPIRSLAGMALQQIGVEAVPSLSKALTDESPDARRLAAQRLGAMGPTAREAIPALLHALQDSDGQVRLQAAYALWQIDHEAKQVIPILLASLKDKDPKVRNSSAPLLAQIGPIPESAVPELQAALKGKDALIRVNAAEALCGLPGHIKEAIPVLLPALRNRFQRSGAIDALAKAGPEAKDAVPALVSLLQDRGTDYTFAGRIGQVLDQISGPEAASTLMKALAGAPKPSRPAIIHALAQTNSSAVAPLVAALNDEDPIVRMLAVRGLGRLGRSVADAVPALVKALQDKDERVHSEAIKSLGQLGPVANSPASSSQAIQALAELVKSEHGSNRIVAAEALAYVAGRDASAPANGEEPGSRGSRLAISTLADVVRSHDLNPRIQAATALGRIGPDAKEAVPALAEAVDSADPVLRLEAAIALAHIGADVPGLLPVLLEVVHDRAHSSRARAIDALGDVACANASAGGGPSAPRASLTNAVTPALVRILWEERPERIRAAEVLGRMGASAKDAVPTLTNILKGSDPQLRIQAALALWKIDRRTKQAVPVLVDALKSPLLPPRTSAAIPGRFGAFNTTSVPICQQAAEALGQMGPDARAAVPVLTAYLKDDQLSSYHPYYALALSKIDRQAAGAAVPALIAVLDGKAHAISRQEAARALGEIGAQARAAVPALRKAVTDPDEAIRSEATEALKKIGA